MIAALGGKMERELDEMNSLLTARAKKDQKRGRDLFTVWMGKHGINISRLPRKKYYVFPTSDADGAPCMIEHDDDTPAKFGFIYTRHPDFLEVEPWEICQDIIQTLREIDTACAIMCDEELDAAANA